MDYESALEAVEAIRSTVPTKELETFDTRITEQYGHAVEAAGSAAVGANVSTPAAELTEEQEGFNQAEIRAFLDPNAELSAESQLTFMSEFWGKLGYEVPELNKTQQAKLAEVVEANPDKRVVPTPLLHVNRRKSVAAKARAIFPEQKFTSNGDALWAPDRMDSLYGKLMSEPTATIKEGRTSYGLRYKAPTGEIVDQDTFQKQLVDSGHAVHDATVWTFPVMDVAVQSPRTNDTAGNLHQKVNPVVTPESLIAMQLLHQANGTPNPQWCVDFANEAVYKLDKKGNPVAPVRVAGVDWDPDRRQVDSDAWGADNQYGSFGVRGAGSGL